MPSTQTRSKKTEAKSGAADDLRKLFEDQLKDMYWAEKALTKALPKMQKNATSEDLVNALNDHLEVTMEQVTRLEEIFGLLGKKAQGKKCEAMEGLIKEGEDIMESTQAGPVRDAGIIGACQKVEHYEIASYGTLLAFANLLAEEEVANALQLTLDEEKEADSILTQVAENNINAEALNAGEEEEEYEEDEEEDNKAGSGKRSRSRNN